MIFDGSKKRDLFFPHQKGSSLVTHHRLLYSTVPGKKDIIILYSTVRPTLESTTLKYPCTVLYSTRNKITFYSTILYSYNSTTDYAN